MFLTVLTLCISLSRTATPQSECCQCNSMRPIGVTAGPQIDPSPFKIKVDRAHTYYRLGAEINGEYGMQHAS